MLKFFRKTRKKLILHPSKGRTGDNVRKYLLYAIGKIQPMITENRATTLIRS
ncbi:MAG: hypothetical protein JJU37_08370 [Balneolaceae bacterium]|nr:hypothetical protein [Balneolaceae bacterium]